MLLKVGKKTAQHFVSWLLGFAMLAITLALSIGAVQAAQISGITPQQIEAFKKLPAAQQEALARQYGVSLNSLFNASAINNLEVQPSAISSNTDTAMLMQSERVEKAREEADKETGDEPLTPFGYDLFNQERASFEYSAEMPIPETYVVGPGDTFTIQLFGQQNSTFNLKVDRNGQIQLPEIGPISLVGMQFDEARAHLLDIVNEKFIGVKASITLAELRSIQVFLLGDVIAPGAYTISALSTITNALMLGGGVADTGSLRKVQLKRNGQVLSQLDLYDLLLSGNTADDKRLQSGDVIYVPPVGPLVGIEGEVQRPAFYEIKGKEIINDVIALSGGLKSTAYKPQVTLTRVYKNVKPSIETLDLFKQGNKKVKGGDVLTIGRVGELVDSYVEIQGAVVRPGRKGFIEGMRISDLVDSFSEDLLRNADLDYGVVVRERNVQGEIEVLPFTPFGVISGRAGNEDLMLKSRDLVLIFNQSKGEEDKHSRKSMLAPVMSQLKMQATPGEPVRVVGISGAVSFPGQFPMPKRYSVRELVAAAGGLTEGAVQGQIEISHVNIEDNGESVVSIENIDVPNINRSKHLLRPRDVVTIKGVPNLGYRFDVTLEGEVRFPGTYTVTKGETLARVIKRAGGVTDLAYLKGAVFTRERLRQQEAERLKGARARLEKDIAGLGTEQIGSRFESNDEISQLEGLLDKTVESQAVGRLVIDLEEQLTAAPQVPVLLEDGDALIVPAKQQAVTVFGEVQFPTSHLVRAGLTVDDYVDLSGGPTQRADESRIYVIRADGSVWLPEKSIWFASGEQLNPGDTIVVPFDIDRINQLELWTNVSQIFYQIALGAAAVRSF